MKEDSDGIEYSNIITTLTIKTNKPESHSKKILMENLKIKLKNSIINLLDNNLFTTKKHFLT